MKRYGLWKRLYSEKGTSSIEFAFYLLIFALMCGFLIDMSFSLIKKSHMERVNYSLTMIFRERNGLFGGGNASDISKSDLDTLKQRWTRCCAKKMVPSSPISSVYKFYSL